MKTARGCGAIVVPSIGLLFRLALTGRLQDGDPAAETVASDATRGLRQGPFGRSAIAFLVAGIALLTVAEASWAHAVGVVCLFGFVVSGFVARLAIVVGQESSRACARE